MNITIPGRDELIIENILLDYNGTIAVDGKIIKSIEKRIDKLDKMGLNIFVLTADTHGTVRKECGHLPLEVIVFDNNEARISKKEIVEKLGSDRCIAIGNGYNDGLMLLKSKLGIAVMGEEGMSLKAIENADVVCRNIEDALDLIIKEKRLIATLRG